MTPIRARFEAGGMRSVLRVYADARQHAGATHVAYQPDGAWWDAIQSASVHTGWSHGDCRRRFAQESRDVKITDIKIVSFRTYADRFGAGTPKPHQALVQTLTSIETDAGVTGYYLGGG